MIAVKLGAVSRVLVASPAYPARHGAPGSLADLAAHDAIAIEGADATNEWRFSEKAVRLGIGIARALSYQVEAAVLAGRLVAILRSFAPPPSPVSAVYPARRIGSANVAAFVKAARDHFRANPVVPLEEWAAPRAD